MNDNTKDHLALHVAVIGVAIGLVAWIICDIIDIVKILRMNGVI